MKKRINTREKMYSSNSKIRKWLNDNGYQNIHFFPHTRFIKDVPIDGEPFDGLATKGNLLILFQCKTNEKPSKKTLKNYGIINRKYGVKCLFLVNFDRKGVECFG